MTNLTQDERTDLAVRERPTSDLVGLARLHQDLRSYLERALDPLYPAPGGFTPAADVEETDDAYVVELELAGIKKDDISVEMAGRRLVVQGERKERERSGVLRKRSRVVGRFYYEVVLPDDAEDAGVSAELDHGVLTVRVPRSAAARPRQIEVR